MQSKTNRNFLLFGRGQRQIWLDWAYFGSFLGLRGPLRPQMCGMVYTDTNKEGAHVIEIPWEILGQGDLLLSYLSVDKDKSGCFGCIWAQFLGLRRAPMAPNVSYSPPKHQLGRWTRYRHSLGATKLLSYLSMDKGKSAQFGRIYAHFLGMRRAPMALNVWYSSPGYQQERQT